MDDATSPQILRYLPIELSGQVFGIPMSDVVAIERAHRDSPSTESTSSEDGEQVGSGAPIVDMRYLFLGESPPDHGRYVVILSAPIGSCAVLVDAVQPTCTAHASVRRVLPSLLASAGCPFGSVVLEHDGPVLIIDTSRLMERMRQVAPELIMERTYAA